MISYQLPMLLPYEDAGVAFAGVAIVTGPYRVLAGSSHSAGAKTGWDHSAGGKVGSSHSAGASTGQGI